MGASGDSSGDSAQQRAAAPAAANAPEWPAERRHRRWLRLWPLGAALAALGAALFLISAWLPWISVVGTGPDQRSYPLLLTPGDLASGLGSLRWSALSVAGVLLLPLVLRRVRTPLAVAGVIAFALWTALAVVAEPSLLAGTQQGSALALDPNFSVPRNLLLAAAPSDLLPYGLHLAALALCVLASALLIVGTLRPETRTAMLDASPAAPARGKLPGMGLLTLGVAVWALGTFVFPWATLGCTGLPLVSSQCLGVPFGTALGYGVSANAGAFDGLLALYAAEFLLTGGAVLVLIATWWGGVSWHLCVWLALWLAAAMLLAVVADGGVGVVVAGHGHLGLPGGAWRGDNGIVTAFLGLLLGWIALGYLTYQLLAGPRRARAST
ncbi:MAG: hypothetical protein ACHQ4H_01370 [Ktedonobacterales bacterium]